MKEQSEVRNKYRRSRKGRETSRAYSRRYYHSVLKFNEIEKQKRRVANRLNHYKLKYGLTPEEADALKLDGCALCGIKTGKMNIDHNHTNGKVRGVLCNPCNLMLGWLEIAIPKLPEIRKYLAGGSIAVRRSFA